MEPKDLMDMRILEALAQRSPVALEVLPPLAFMTSFKTGGPASLSASPRDTDQLTALLGFAGREGLPVFLLGGGTNVLFDDLGLLGLVVRLAGRFAEVRGPMAGDGDGDGEMRVWAGAGARLSQVADVARGLGRIGWARLRGIPGTVGGALVMNAGAAGVETGDLTVRVDVLEPAPGMVSIAGMSGTAGMAGTAGMIGMLGAAGGAEASDSDVSPNAEGYPASPASQASLDSLDSPASPDSASTNAGNGEGPAGKVVRVPASAAGFRYRGSDLGRKGLVLGAELLLGPGAPDGEIQALERATLEARRARIPGGPSAGSVFRNPPEGPAGKIIDDCGLKGLKVGGAQVSPRHANVIVNTGSATSSEVRELAWKVRYEVMRLTGIELVPEIRMVDRRGGEYR
jgi:UDP-N-acetylenolpyruvoylglucosamine reductase